MHAATPRLAAAFVGGLLLVPSVTAAPIGWRSDGTGIYPNATPPTDWAEAKAVWKTKLPGPSFGSPILAGDRIFVVSDPADLLCIDRADGKILWQHSHSLADLFDAATADKVTAEFARLKADRDRLRGEADKAKDDPVRKAELKKQTEAAEAALRDLMKKYPGPPALFRRDSGNSAATPTSDGKNVFALFGNGIACAYTKTGEKLWVKYIEPSQIGFGHSSSPVLVDGKVLVHLNDLVALDASTGEEVWRVALSARHATAVPTMVGTTSVVVSPAGAVVRVADGNVLLRNGNLSSSECTHVLHDGIIYACHDKARALRLVAAGDDAVKVQQLWECRISGGRRTPSSVVHDGLLYAVTTGGLLDVVDAKSGELLYQQRLNIGEVYASATVAGDYLFFGGTRGTAIALEPGKEYHEVARTQIEGFGSSPVFNGQRLYLRTRQHLYCIGK
jgi:outer membrane protein assembly factor BamB